MNFGTDWVLTLNIAQKQQSVQHITQKQSMEYLTHAPLALN